MPAVHSAGAAEITRDSRMCGGQSLVVRQSGSTGVGSRAETNRGEFGNSEWSSVHNPSKGCPMIEVKGPQSYFPSIEKKYGKPVAVWLDAIAASRSPSTVSLFRC